MEISPSSLDWAVLCLNVWCTALWLHTVFVKRGPYLMRDETLPVVTYEKVNVVTELCCESEERVNSTC